MTGDHQGVSWPADGSAIPWPVETLVPHRGPMVLLDEATRHGPGWAEAAVRIAEDTLFYQPGRGVPAWVGVEYMAQTIALYSGLKARAEGRPVPVGFLLGTRRYACHAPYFRLGLRLEVLVVESLIEGSMGVFDCAIRAGDVIAEARLNVYVPRDLDQLSSAAAP